MTATQSNALTRRGMLARIGLIALALGVPATLVGWLVHVALAMQLGLMCAGLGALWLVCARFTSSDRLRGVDRRYMREFFPAMIAYVIVLLVTLPMLAHTHGVIGRSLIAVLPVLPIVFVVRAMVRRIRDGDELERRVQLEAISIASLTVAMLSMAAGFLQAAGVLRMRAPLILVLPAMFAVYGVAVWWVKRRYRDE